VRRARRKLQESWPECAHPTGIVIFAPPRGPRNAERAQREGRAKVDGAARRGQGHYRGRSPNAAAWCLNEGTAVAQWQPRLAPPRLSPWQLCSCSLHTPFLEVGYLDNQLKGRSPAKLVPIPFVSLWTSDSPAAPNFLELRQGEVRRMPLLRASVKKAAACLALERVTSG
jgi:hypothetical protein